MKNFSEFEDCWYGNSPRLCRLTGTVGVFQMQADTGLSFVGFRPPAIALQPSFDDHSLVRLAVVCTCQP